ncbi:hypothetical protein [Schlesneria sp.]|uniref:hypothetical protein n=1 Tax=Schlesneria sp. TaxID=2762018 RepID=UPI002EE5DCAF
MWNGFWKLTVMVGVIGVGLFAVFQAQQGMNRAATMQPSVALGDVDTPEDSAEETDSEAPDAGAASSVSVSRLDEQRSPVPRKRPTDTYEEGRIDLVGRFNSEKATVKTAMGGATKARSSSERQVAAIDLQPPARGLSFRDDVELVELEVPEEATEAPQSLPDEEEESLFSDSDEPSMKQSAEASAEEEQAEEEAPSAAPEASFDPFDSDSPAAKEDVETEAVNEAPPAFDELEEVTEENSPSEKSATKAETKEVAEPAPSKSVIDFGDEAVIPRSRRATLGKEKKTEGQEKKAEPAATEAPSFQETPEEAATDKDAPPQDEPESIEEEPKSDPLLPGDGMVEEEKQEDETPSAVEAPPAFEEFDAEEEPAPKSKSKVTPPAKSQIQSLPEPKREPVPALGNPSTDTLSTPPGLFPVDDEPAPKSPASDRKRLSLPGLPLEPQTTPNRRLPEPEMFERDTREEEDSDREPFSPREPAKRRSDPDSIAPSDLVGDGVAGDPSQQGVQQPRLTIEKVAQHQAVVDQPLIYTIIVRNTGSVVAHNVVVEDRIPKGTELMGTSPRAELVGKRLIWNELVLKPNEEKKISIKVIPKQEGPIGSVARLYFATEVSAEIQVATPQLDFTVKAPHEVRPGQTVDLIFYLKNIGTVDASNILVRDIIPENFKHDEGTDIECAIGKLAPNEVREIVLPVTAMSTGTGTNRAILTADSGIKKELDHTINVVGEVLVLTRSGHNRVYVSRPATFTSNIRNEGNQRVANVRISEVVPAGMEFEAASEGGRYDPKQRAVHWTLGPLGPGDDLAVSVKYVPKETGTHVGKVTATGASGSTASVNSTVEVVGRPELQMETLSATGVVSVGDRITSKMQLKNSGTAPARNVRLSLRIPPELRLVEVRGRRYQQQGDQILFESIDELNPQGNAGFELTLEPIEEADAKIQLEISAEHLSKPHRRDETIQIVHDILK